MKLNLYDSQLNRIAIIGEQFISCLWSEGYNTMGSFSLELQTTEEYKLKVKPDCYVGREDRNTLMVIKSVSVDGSIVATGKPATRLLSDVAFVGTIEEGSDIASSLKMAYDSSYQYPLVLWPESEVSASYKKQISHKSMLELSETLCRSADIGLKAVRVDRNIEIQLYRPERNPNLKFSQAFGNLKDPSISLSNENHKNYAVVLGQGEDEERIREDVDLSDGMTRKELIVDARDLQQGKDETEAGYRGRLSARGYEKLLGQAQTWKCAFTPLAEDFGTRFDLGDILTVLLPDFGIKLQARVAKFSQKEQRNRIQTTIDVGDLTVMRR